jgi:hypothetical protein
LVLLVFLTIVPIVPRCTKYLWYKNERITIGITIFFELYQLYQGFKKNKKIFLFFIQKSVYN